MMRVRSSKSKIDTVFVLMIFCVFAISVLLVLILSASTYRNMTDVSREGQNERIILSYIRTKIRNADTAGGIGIMYFHGIPALSITEEFGGRTFVTLIYHYNGWAHELFHEAGIDFLPRDGVRLVRVESLDFELAEAGLIRISTDHGSTLISRRSEGEGF